MNRALLILASFVLTLSSTVFAQDAKLIEAAKKEGGKVVVYGSLDSDTIGWLGAYSEPRTTSPLGEVIWIS